jgi:hypothetical protein
MSRAQPRADGSAHADAPPTVEISRSGAAKWRWRCPNGHTDWDATNNHIWCRGCRRAAENGADVDPEHWEIVDERTGDTVAWSAIEIVP